ncbi:arylsulfatase [Aquimarina agarilytica]|uniref:arylsulfatase n=1 Tax=Aquimarina agarilytica TaxID=1087449 RepID=UPI000288DB6D|nr:arylsulfatase [Aquimarina agarilytica]
MKIKIFKTFFATAILFSYAACNTTEKKIETAQVSQKYTGKNPNIIFLLADDMGYGELGSYGQKDIKTPFLDELASKGLRFTDFYAGTSVCAPSRATLMTGKHTGHATIRANGGANTGKSRRVPLSKSEITLGEMLQGAGYQTAMIGKWHLGIPEDMSTWAKGRGFDYAVQEQWGENEKGILLDEREHWVNNNQDSVFYNYNNYKCLDEFRTNFALEYLDKKKSDKPFFLYMSYRIPHAHEFFLSKTDLYEDKMEAWPEIERRHAARITMLDSQIKRLFNKLKERGELENTLIIFSSDNGPHKENYHDNEFFKSSGGLKGYKRALYEGGIRVPMIAYWEGKIPEGNTTKHQATFYDIMPTLAEVANIPIPKQTDGISFLPELTRKSQKKHEHLYWEIHESGYHKSVAQAARMGNWKAVRTAKSGKTELYDLSKDVFEINNVAEDNPEIVHKMNEIFNSESTKSKHYPLAGGLFKM